MTKEPFEQLQNEVAELSKKLRNATEELVVYKSWFHVLKRIEQDNTMQQSLIGWLQTVKKIGKGTGKKAPMLKRKARENMLKCQKAVPAWIMSVSKAMDYYDPRETKFDVVIIDEASQSDISALGLFLIADRVIVVGDSEQVSPSSIGMVDETVAKLRKMYIDDKIPNDHLYDGQTSLYDIAMTTFKPLMLREHFRCVPDIINYSNKLSYDGKITPLRDTNGVLTLPYFINFAVDGKRDDTEKFNLAEAESTIALIKACTEQKEYKDKTFGVISLLGNENSKQVRELLRLAAERLDTVDMDNRKLRIGAAPDFQGDERDIIFLNLIDSNNTDGPLRLSDKEKKETKQRYNVAVSRARDQIWVVNSLDVSRDLKSDDIRKDLLEYANNPKVFSDKILNIKDKSDSPFESEVATYLISKGYNLTQQWKVGAYRIDMVISYQNKKIALECDGERHHSSDEQVKKDMERQSILERLGWTFIRLRGSEYYRNKEQALNRIIEDLNVNEIYPETSHIENSASSDLLDRIKIRYREILEEWKEKFKIEDLDYGSTENHKGESSLAQSGGLFQWIETEAQEVVADE